VAQLITPDAEQVRAILAESHSLWGAGLTLPSYSAMWEEMAASPWGRKWFSWRALLDDTGRMISSLKLYRPELRVDGETLRACALGAVFTPRALRRRGHAAQLIRAVLAEASARGDGPGFLFTDIGTEYYARLGFVPLPCEDVVGTLAGAPDPRARGVTFRTMDARDLERVAAGHARACAERAIAVLRDREHWECLLLRSETFFRRLDGSGLEGRFQSAEERGLPIGYLVGVVGAGEWNIREAAAYDGSDETLARILAAGGAEAAVSGAASVWGWIPRAWFPLVPSWRPRVQPRPRAIPMLRPKGGGPLAAALTAPDRAFLPYLDQF